MELLDLIRKKGSMLEGDGVCFGFACSWLFAACVGGASNNEFFRRLDRLYQEPTSDAALAKIERAKHAYQNKIVSLVDRQWLAMEAWLDVVSLAQNLQGSGSDLRLIGKKNEQYLTPSDIVSYVTSRETSLCSIRETQRRGGLFCHYNRSSVLSDRELKGLLFALSEVVGNTNHAVFIHAPEHAFGLQYQADRKLWRIVDVDLMRERGQTGKAYKDLPLKEFIDEFKCSAGSTRSFTAFNFKLFTTATSHLTLSPIDNFFSTLNGNDVEFHRRDAKGFGLLMLEVNEKNERVVCSLLEKDYKVSNSMSEPSQSAFFRSLVNNLLLVVHSFIRLNKAPLKGINTTPLLSLLLSRSRYQMTTLLLQLPGLSIDFQQNEKHYTPLHFALIQGHQELARLLIERGASLYNCCTSGNNSLHFACFNSLSKEFYVFLVRRGKLFTSQNKLKQTPLDVACLRGNFAAIDALIEEALLQGYSLEQLVSDKHISLVNQRHIKVREPKEPVNTSYFSLPTSNLFFSLGQYAVKVFGYDADSPHSKRLL